MMKNLLLLSLTCMGIFAGAGCKKKEDGPPPLSAFAQNLKASCTSPFMGKGDSSGVYLPTAFSPNGDGINDVYWLVYGQNKFSSFSLHIYDTTGTLVYETASPTFRWEGTNNSTGAQSTGYRHYVKVTYTTTGGITDSGGTYVFMLASSAAKTCVYAVPADANLYRFPDQYLADTGLGAGITTNERFCN